jgi:hypothetical protein
MARIARQLGAQEGFEARFAAFIRAFTGFYDDHPHAAIFLSDNLAALWPQTADAIGGRTIVTLTRDLLDLGRREGLVDGSGDLSLQVIVVIGALGQLIRQLYLQALKGPAKTHARGIERMLRAGLA